MTVDWQRGVGAFHERYRPTQVRPQHRRGPLLRLLRYTTTGWSGSGEEVWHGSLGAVLYAAVGHGDSAAYLGSGTVAALFAENTHWVLGG
jgi:hypothetical protein